MAQVRNITPGYVVIHPNREKAACKLVRLIVVLILLASVALMLILTIGGWSKLAGMKPLNFIWALLYLVCAFYIWRWARGLLPIAAALGILLLIVAVIAGTGLAGTSWFDRNHYGFAPAQSLFGGSGLGAHDARILHRAADPDRDPADRVRDDRLRAGLERRDGSARGRGPPAWDHPRPPRPSARRRLGYGEWDSNPHVPKDNGF